MTIKLKPFLTPTLRAVAAASILALIADATLAANAAKTGFNFTSGSLRSAIGLYSSNTFVYVHPLTGTPQTVVFGDIGDTPLAADYDGDGITDLAVYRPSTRQFWWKRSSDNVVSGATFGDPGDIPIAADFDGDGKTDIAIYRPSEGYFAYRRSSDDLIGYFAIGPAYSVPLVGDVDGDGKSDPIVFDARSKTYHWISSGTQQTQSQSFPTVAASAVPVVGNYISTNLSTLAVFEPIVGAAKFSYYSGGALATKSMPGPGVPLSVDYDGDGKADFAIARRGNGNHIVTYIPSARTGTATTSVTIGSTTNYPSTIPLGQPFYQPGWMGNFSGAFVQKSSTIQTVHQQIVPHTAASGQVITTRQSDSFLPLCVFHAIQGNWAGHQFQSFQEAEAADFNCIHTAYNVDGIWDWKAPNLYSALANTSLKAIIDIGTNYALSNLLTPSQIAEIRTHVQNYKNHPNILAWKLEDEGSPVGEQIGDLQIQANRLSNFRTLVDVVQSEDPIHSAMQVDVSYPSPGLVASQNANYSSQKLIWEDWNSPGTSAQPKSRAKVVSIDHYPFHFPGTELSIGVCDGGVVSFPDAVLTAVQFNPSKPVWLALQGHELTNNPASHFQYKFPTPTQLRLQVFTGLVHGATGIIYFAYDGYPTRGAGIVGMAPNPAYDYGGGGATAADLVQLANSRAVWQAATLINGEVEKLKNSLLVPTSQRAYSVFIEDRPDITERDCTPSNSTAPSYSAAPIRTLLKEDPASGLFTLFVVNLDKRSVKAKFELPGLAPFDLRTLDQNGKNTSIAHGNDSFSDTIEDWGVRVYQFKSAATN